jgi:hypothetical protein
MTIRTVSLSKDGHAWVFRYPAGQEDRVVEELMYLAEDRTSAFDWVDAATLSFQVTEFAARDCHAQPEDGIAAD